MSDLETVSDDTRQTTSALRQFNESDDKSLREWIEGIDAGPTIKVQIHRRSPTTGPGGENVAGLLDEVDELPDEKSIQSTWGGGTFQIKIFRPNTKGSMVYFKARTLKIAGEPKMAGKTLGSSAPVIPIGGSGGDEAVERAMSMAERMARRSEERLDRVESEGRKGGGLDMDALQTLLEPYRVQLEAANTEARELRAQIVALSNRPVPVDAFRDRMLERMHGGEEARVETLRATYEARIEKLRDSHDDAIKRLEDRHADDLRRLEKLHDRALDTVREGASGRLDGSKLGYEARIDSLKSENAKLERELATMGARLATLEAKKDQSLTDKADELVKVRDALEGLGGGSDKDESLLEKAIGALGSSEAVLALINKIGGGGGGPQLPPPGVPFQGPDGQAWMVGPDGQPHPLPARQRAALAVAARKQRKRPAAQAAPGQPQPGVADEALADDDGDDADDAPTPAEKTPDAKDVKLAVTFMEAALANGTPAATFAATVRSSVPADVLRYIQRVGIDALLDIAVEPSSSLNDQLGRNYARAVAKALTGS